MTRMGSASVSIMGMTPQSFKVIQESPLLSTKEYREMLEILEDPISGHHPRTIALAKKTRSTLARMLYQVQFLILRVSGLV